MSDRLTKAREEVRRLRNTASRALYAIDKAIEEKSMPMNCGLGLGLGGPAIFASMGDGGGFEWDPNGVTFGIDFTTDRVFDGESVSDEYAPIFGGAFESSAISSRGMAIFDTGTNFPDAAGDLLSKFQTLDFTLVYFWEQAQVQSGHPLLTLLSAGDGYTGDFFFDASQTWASDQNGTYPNLGLARPFSDNVIALSFNDDGILASLNGATAQLSEGAFSSVLARVKIGHDVNESLSGSELEGWLKALIFYPATSFAADIEAYSANSAPVNTVAPEVTGTAQVGQQLSVSTGTWTGSPTSYEYQWYRDNFNGPSAVAGATASTFTPTVAEEGSIMKCVVRAISVDGVGGIGVTDDDTVSPA